MVALAVSTATSSRMVSWAQLRRNAERRRPPAPWASGQPAARQQKQAASISSANTTRQRATGWVT